MRPTVEETAKKKFGSDFPIKHLFEVKANEKCIVVGTIYKHMKLKPNILHELSEEHSLSIPPPPLERYTSDDDELILEDDLQRITLIGNIDVS